MEELDRQIASEKAKWRERFLIARAKMPPEDRAAASAAIVDRLLALPEVRTAQTVHVFWPMLDRGEIDTRPLIADQLRRGKLVVLPVVKSRRGQPPLLEHREIVDEASLVRTPWGLLEPPASSPVVQPSELDVVIVPALGASRLGERIGHGAGFYDAFLAATAAPRVCVVYDACLADALPTAAYDEAMDGIVTESTLIRLER